ncbi:unnamed protein product [Clavelina lepadiformis]|uniref:Choline transporter-like protein n=1 Tax=Clavelina lepadiformis TaxID=159417 RepID=A0ABP0FYS1_CLALP
MGCCGGNEDTTDEKPYGQPKSHDPSFKGPIKKRSCTDIICCLLFFVFILGFITIGLFAWLNGDPVILLYPTDNQGRICGVNYGDLDLSSKTNVFYFDITQCTNPAFLLSLQCATTQICVPSCPSELWTYFPDVAKTVALELRFPGDRTAASNEPVSTGGVDWSKYICTYGFNVTEEYVNGMSIQEIVSAGMCAPYYVPMTPVVSRCVPQVNNTVTSFLYDGTQELVSASQTVISGSSLQNGTNELQQFLAAREIADAIFADFTASWYWLLALMAISALVAFLWIVIMRWFAGVIVWITLLGLIGLLSFGVWYCYNEYNILKTANQGDESIISVGFTTNLSTYLALQDTWLAFLIILAVVDFILILIVLFLRKRIQIAIQIIRQASKAVGMMISTLFYPLVTFVLVLIVVAFWAATALFLASSGDPVYGIVDSRNDSQISMASAPYNTSLSGDQCVITEWTNTSHPLYLVDEVKCVFEKYGGDSIFHQNVTWLQVVEVFGMLWILNWIIALGQCTLAGAFSSYYWAWKKPRDIPFLPLYSSFGRALRYHTGSLAFGALIIAIVQIIRILLEYADHKLKGTENKVAKFILKCLKCCFWCLEKFLKFLNRNAYIMVAVYGKNFCWSAKEAFKLLMRNILRVVVLDKVTDFILFMGKLIVTVGMGALSWAFFTDKFPIRGPSLNYYWLMIIVIAVGTYFVASGFFNTFAMAVDTIFLCFLEDLERNDGSEQKPYYMSKGLMKVLGKKNKKVKDK